MNRKRALIAMSGGVDSSVAALLMQEQGYDPIGVTMKLYDNEDAGMCNTHTCCSLKDIEDARAVAARLGFPYYVVNFMEGFSEKIIHPFIQTYLRGETPNPCVECNRFLKFGTLMQRAEELGCEKAVTGHYARIFANPETGEYELHKALDDSKDQSYVLYFLNQDQLSRLAFPLGDRKKTEVREIAEQHGLINAAKHDSQDICFVPDGNYARVIDEYLAEIPDCHVGAGNFVDRNGKILGRHRGYYHYTIGQRKGLGISAKEPLYVTGIRPRENVVVLGSNEDLMRKTVCATDFSFVNRGDETRSGPIPCAGKIRYRARESEGTLEVLRAEQEGKYFVRMVFDQPVRAVTPGQFLVAYDGDRVIGGGRITENQ